LNDEQATAHTRNLQEMQAYGGEYREFEPERSLIRSLDELYKPPKDQSEKFFDPSAEEQFQGWSPELVVLSEADLKKMEKQEERQQRYRNRGQRR
jgi:hypothetical protein